MEDLKKIWSQETKMKSLQQYKIDTGELVSSPANYLKNT